MRYIDGDRLKWSAFAVDKDTFTFDDLIDLIDAEKTADVRENAHARWIDCEGIPVCSRCGHATDDSILLSDGTAFVSRFPRYCGKCGAEMDAK